jgi:hypothetical protein
VPSADVGASNVTCSTPCSACTGKCSAGRCYETIVVSKTPIVNNVSTGDSTSLYWVSTAPDAGLPAYTVWRADKTTGSTALLASSTVIANGILLWPVAGAGLAGTFYTTVNAQGEVVAASPGGTRLLSTVDGGLVGGLTVSAAGLIAAVGVSGQPTVKLLRLPLDGGEATTLYSEGVSPLYGTSGRVTSFGAGLAWLTETPDASAVLLTGTIDAGAPLTLAANAPAINSVALFAMDASHVYWSPAATSPTGPMTVYRAPLGGGTPEPFVTADAIDSIAVDGTDFYWAATTITGTGPNRFSHAVLRTPTASAGGARTLLSCAAANVSIDDQSIYLTTGGSITRTPK